MAAEPKIKVLFVDDEDDQVAYIREWADALDLEWEKVDSIEEAEQMENYRPTIWLVDDDFEYARPPADRSRRGLEFLKDILRRDDLEYDTVVRLVSKQLGPDRKDEARKEKIRMIAKTPQRELREGLVFAYQEALTKRAAWPRSIRSGIEDLYNRLRDQHQQEKPFDVRNTVFVITPFAGGDDDEALKSAIFAAETGIKAAGYIPLRADMQPGELTGINELVRCYMHLCNRAVAIFFRRKNDQNLFNPNVALETGYMQALGKKILPILCGSDVSIPADLQSIVYERPDQYGEHIDLEMLSNKVESWLSNS